MQEFKRQRAFIGGQPDLVWSKKKKSLKSVIWTDIGRVSRRSLSKTDYKFKSPEVRGNMVYMEKVQK